PRPALLHPWRCGRPPGVPRPLAGEPLFAPARLPLPAIPAPSGGRRRSLHLPELALQPGFAESTTARLPDRPVDAPPVPTGRASRRCSGLSLTPAESTVAPLGTAK